jgi:hypothetical protein
MSLPVSIITPSLARDFEACRLLCDTLDAYVSGFDAHYVVVGAADLPLFAPLAGPRRHVVDEATLLPRRLMRLPVKWKGRSYRWAPGTMPIYGWHIQQLLKFGMTLRQPNPRVIFIDSDNFFVRRFDLAAFAGSESVPLQVDPGAVKADWLNHLNWLGNAHRLLRLPEPIVPADDFIGQLIVWDVAIVREILRRIEVNTGRSWWKALIHARAFSEYMIYGAAVTNDAEFMARHHIVSEHPCLSYWNGPAMSEGELRDFATRLRPDQSALGIQSFTGTPVAMLRALALPTREAA